MRTASRQRDLGSAISIEDALSMLTIIFVVFMLLLVPLVNLNRVKLENETKDPFWKSVAVNLKKELPADSRVSPYTMAFDLDSSISQRISRIENTSICYIEALFADSSVTVICHNRKENSFVAVFCSNDGAAKTFRKGFLNSGNRNSGWIISDSHEDYGDDPECLEMEARYRTWFLDMQKKRG
jgi:hypothetical protein